MSQTVVGRPELKAARLLLERLGICPADLLQVRPARPPAPTFAGYVPMVAAAVSSGTRRAYGSYWHRVVRAWGDRRIDEPRPYEIEQLRAQVQANLVARRNAEAAAVLVAHSSTSSPTPTYPSRGSGRNSPGGGSASGVEKRANGNAGTALQADSTSGHAVIHADLFLTVTRGQTQANLTQPPRR